jgi:citrate lyase beta subunit
MEYLKLGASLYVPASRKDLLEISKGKYPEVRSFIIDTEDSIYENELENSYENIRIFLNNLNRDEIDAISPLIFIRVRNPVELKFLNSFENIFKIDGFVLPKFCVMNMEEYFKNFLKDMWYMPILETNIFTESQLLSIRDALLEKKDSILSVRIGITDILFHFKSKRNNKEVIYNNPIANFSISRIISAFIPHDINVTGCVFDAFDIENTEILRKEVQLDLNNGIFGKTAIHPWQVKVINDVYRVPFIDYEIAINVLNKNNPAVFNIGNTMQERIPHYNWAKRIVALKDLYGLQD